MAAGLAVALALAGCQRGGPDAARPPLPVSSEDLRVERFSEVVDTVSTLEALDQVELAAQAGGRIEQLRIRQGDPVQAGQLLVVLDQTQARAEVLRLRAEVDTNRLNFQRYEFLVRQAGLTESLIIPSLWL
ncbi:MAG: biotin/lipoyl-binding protein [Cyanobium sp.]